MIFFFILALIISILAVVFALQNAQVVEVKFLTWSLEGSLALILLLSFAGGVTWTLLILFPQIVKKSLDIVKKSNKIKELESKILAKERETESKKEDKEENSTKGKVQNEKL